MTKPIFFSLNSNIIRYEEFEDTQRFPGCDDHPRTAHDWQPYRARVSDDGTQTFFW